MLVCYSDGAPILHFNQPQILFGKRLGRKGIRDHQLATPIREYQPALELTDRHLATRRIDLGVRMDTATTAMRAEVAHRLCLVGP